MLGMAVHAWYLSSWEMEAVRLEFKVIVSHTARPPRTYEVWGVRSLFSTIGEDDSSNG